MPPADRVLRRLRFPVNRSRGRRYPEPAHPYRNEFQRDRDRIVHARAFRRLENKTQVFTAGLSDHFRNRLTHTIEVAQIARTAASVLGLDEDFTEALALVHDIGHPPFAHAGENELNRRMQAFGSGFDHNLHALRVVETLEHRYARFPGLNLTFEVREGIVKHSQDFEKGEFRELDEYLPGLRPPLEAQLIDLADEVAYNTADLDDAFSANMFTLEDVAGSVPQFRELWEQVQNQFPGATERVHFQEILRALIDLLVSGLIEGTVTAVERAHVQDVEQVRGYPRRLVSLSETGQATSVALRNFLHHRVYFSEALVSERSLATARIGELFHFFLENPDRVPENYRDLSGDEPSANERSGSELGPRVVCDYIAGMTDGFFLRTYQQLLAS